jgi:hypothetical protein
MIHVFGFRSFLIPVSCVRIDISLSLKSINDCFGISDDLVNLFSVRFLYQFHFDPNKTDEIYVVLESLGNDFLYDIKYFSSYSAVLLSNDR